jgi:hypothetical protein
MNALPTAGQDLPIRDIHAPAPPSIWPPAPGWWILAGVGLVLLGLGLWWLYRRYRLAQRRRRILDQLAGLPSRATGALLAAEVSALLKRVALARYPRTEVASLTGTPWLELLDRTGGGGRFARGPGRVLAEGPYAPAPDIDTDALLALAGDWIRRNL